MKKKSIEIIKGKYECLESFLNERSRRIWAAAEAEAFGPGGRTVVFQAAGIDYKTIRKGMDEIKNKKNTGICKNSGREYSGKGKPVEMNVHCFTGKNSGRVSPAEFWAPEKIKNGSMPVLA